MVSASRERRAALSSIPLSPISKSPRAAAASRLVKPTWTNRARRPRPPASSCATSTSNPTMRAGSVGSASTNGAPPSASPPQRSSPEDCDQADDDTSRNSTNGAAHRRMGLMIRASAPPPAFEFFERAWPVFTKQPRQRPIGEQAAAGLAVRAVVGLVRCVDDPLNRTTAIRARQPVAPMNSHPFTEGGDFFRKLLARLLLKQGDPARKRLVRCLVEPPQFFVGQRRRLLERREARRVENLVGVRVADAAEQMRIGQGAFERVVVLAKRGGKGEETGFKDVDPARIVLLQRLESGDNMQRRLPFGPCLCKHKRAVAEIEREQPDLAGNSCSSFLPTQPAGNH